MSPRTPKEIVRHELVNLDRAGILKEVAAGVGVIATAIAVRRIYTGAVVHTLRSDEVYLKEQGTPEAFDLLDQTVAEIEAENPVVHPIEI